MGYNLNKTSLGPFIPFLPSQLDSSHNLLLGALVLSWASAPEDPLYISRALTSDIMVAWISCGGNN